MQRTLKRLIDLAVAVPLLVLLSPVMLAVAIAVRVSMGRPVLFCQRRPGLNSVPFALVKFRSMSHQTDASGALLPDEQRMTRVGRFLRRTSLDELPQLWNVVCGDLSLVGPRPLLLEYLDRYTPEQMRRHQVPPGITGWTQVNGRNALSWEEKFALDIWYVDNWSLKLDFVILWRTLLSVIRRDGISQAGHVTMPKFMGTVSRDTQR